MPSISEILAELEDQQLAWNDRFYSLACIEDNRGLVELVAKSAVAIAAEAERREQRRAAEEERQERQRKYREAKAAPVVLGDRVRHTFFGPGVIAKPSEPGWDGWYVLFDNNRGTIWLETYCFENLVEGDEGFAPPPCPALLEHKQTVPMAPLTLCPVADPIEEVRRELE